MIITKTVDEVRKQVKDWKAEGLTVGLCPTMGFLHEGHASLMVESAKQCGRSKLASVGELISFSEIDADDKQVFAFYEFERNNKVSDVIMSDKDIAVVIGSEGGFSVEEYDIMLKKGWHVLTLGKRILRVSTAVVSALTLVNERAGEL